MAAAWTEQQQEPETDHASPSTSASACSSTPSGSHRENKRLDRAAQGGQAPAQPGVHRGHRLPGPARARQGRRPPARHLPLGRTSTTTSSITGATGTGKTYLACALAQQACRKGYRALYRRASRLFDELALARADGTYARLLAQLARVDVLVIDDWGLAPLRDQERRDLLEILEDRYGTALDDHHQPAAAEQWHDYLGDPTLADAICDRLLHNAHRLVLKGPSRRKEETTKELDLTASVASLRSRCADPSDHDAAIR